MEDVINTTLYAHHMVGSVIPMLFSPVPGTHVFRKHREYLLDEMNWDFQNLNGKLLPFLEYNQRSNPALRASDYLELEGLMSILNKGKVLSRAVDICGDTTVGRSFRKTLHVHKKYYAYQT